MNSSNMHSLHILAWRNLAEHRLRTILSTLAVALGVSMIVASDVAGSGFRTGFESGVEAEEIRQSFSFMFDAFETGLNAVGLAILASSIFLIFNAFAMSVTQREKQISTLRALGMTRGQAARLMILEALIVGSAGTVVGLAAGLALGQGVLALLRAAGFGTGEGTLSMLGLVQAVGLGLATVLLSILFPMRRAMHVSPLTALRELLPSSNQAGRVRLLAGIGLGIVTVLGVYLIVAPPGEWALPPWNLRMPVMLSLLWLCAMAMTLPALIGGLSHAGRSLFGRLMGASGRLVADNLGRDRRRVTWTILTFVVGIAMMVSLTGIIRFSFEVLFRRVAESALLRPRWIISRDQTGGEPSLEAFSINPEVIEEVGRIAEERAEIGEYYYVLVPEISAIFANFPSLMIDADMVLGPGGFVFIEGDLQSARDIMEAGCGLLLTPGVAARNAVGAGDTLVVQGMDGPVECTVAGVGSGGFFYPTSFVSLAAKDLFKTGTMPSLVYIVTLPGADADALEADLGMLAQRFGSEAVVGRIDDTLAMVFELNETFSSFLSSLLLLAVLAAALGVVNTTTASVVERRLELGLLRAVGATRWQTTWIVAGEAMLIGLVGGLFGLITGGGVSLVYALSHGGNSYGLPDLPLWEAGWEATWPALQTGLVSLVAIPLISALAAWIPSRSILRGTAIETMDVLRTRQKERKRR